MTVTTYSLDDLAQVQLVSEQEQQKALMQQRESEKRQIAGSIAARVRKLLDNDDLDGLKALENGTLPPNTVPQDDHDQLQQEKDAADQKIAQLTTQVDQLKQENQQLKANATPATSPRKAQPPALAVATPPAAATAAQPVSPKASATVKKSSAQMAVQAVRTASRKFVTGETKH